VDLGTGSWPVAGAASRRGAVLVVPLGSFEQHGPHLPLLTDSLIVEEVARRAASALGDEVARLPVLWLGASQHHIGFAGTLAAQNERYIGLIDDVLECAVESGFRRVLLLNGHGGNEAPARVAMYNVRYRRRQERGLHLALVSWWSLVRAPDVERAGCRQKAISHACEWETSALLAFRPELVPRDAAPRTGVPEQPPECARWRALVDEARQFAELTPTGSLGLPDHASAAKGEVLIEAASTALVELLRDMASWQDRDGLTGARPERERAGAE